MGKYDWFDMICMGGGRSGKIIANGVYIKGVMWRAENSDQNAKIWAEKSGQLLLGGARDGSNSPQRGEL